MNHVNASLGHNPSYTWHSIMVAQSLIRKGLRWRVGDGAHIHVWKDKWLPSPTTYKVASPRIFLHVDTRVKELIDAPATKWKAPIIDTLFLPYEAELIKSIMMIPYFVCPQFACWTPKPQKYHFFFLHGAMRTSKTMWRTRSSTEATKVPFSTEMSKMPLVNPRFD